MDVLSEILDQLEMRGSLYFSTAFSAPWSIDVPADTNVCRFHVVVQGPCRITVTETGDALDLAKGDLVLVPHGNAHWLQSDVDEPLRPLPEVLAEGHLDDGRLRWGGGGAETRMVCGYFDFDKETTHPLLDALPGLIPVRATSSYDFTWIDNLTRFIGQEAGSGRPGSDAIARRLSEVLFIQVVRQYADTAPSAVPVLSAIVHPQLGRALRAVHAEPGGSWTVDAMAGAAALSRTAFAESFHRLVGQPPMTYLTQLRMRHARRLLRTELATAAVGERVGYQSEAAFHRAFKRAYGLGPGAYRRSARA
ncbi:MAG: AraC family transcriptional regulator [Acidobacteriota bacterium]